MNETAEQFKEQFLKWADLVGDHRAADAVKRFEACRASLKERGTQALREMAKDE